MFKIKLHLESAAVLLRCLSYGEAAVSEVEYSSGLGAKIEDNCQMLRKQVCRGLTEEILKPSSKSKPHC